MSTSFKSQGNIIGLLKYPDFLNQTPSCIPLSVSAASHRQLPEVFLKLSPHLCNVFFFSHLEQNDLTEATQRTKVGLGRANLESDGSVPIGYGHAVSFTLRQRYEPKLGSGNYYY